MRRIVALAALAASVALAAPAEAKTRKAKTSAHRAPAAAVHAREGSPSDPYAVYVSGEYIGRDPDPGIRAFMIRNPHMGGSELTDVYDARPTALDGRTNKDRVIR